MAEEKTPDNNQLRILGNMKTRAQRIVQDHDELRRLLEKTKKKLERAKEDDSLMRKMSEYIRLVLRMITNSVNGSYKNTPWQTIVMLVAGFLYFVAPLDALPDFIPVAGFIDDATVLVWLGRCFHDDLARYKNWESVNDSES